jgi:hypothetical protein
MNKDLAILAQQLDNELKELIAIDTEAGVILVYWRQDDSYVTWRYSFNGERFNFDLGHYFPAERTEALTLAMQDFDDRRL